MKTAIFFTVIALCAACADPEIEDSMAGNWKVSTLDISNTKPVISVEFGLKPKGGTYVVSVHSVVINGTAETGYTGTVSNVIPSDKATITLQSGNKVIVLTEFNNLIGTPVSVGATIQNIEYRNSTDLFNYPLQSASR